MVDINKVVEMNDHASFKAKFVGGKSYLKGLTVKPDKVYSLTFMGKFGRDDWLWFEIANTKRSLFGTKSAQCPYTSIDTFMENWKLL